MSQAGKAPVRRSLGEVFAEGNFGAIPEISPATAPSTTSPARARFVIEVAGTVIHRVAGGELTEGWWNWDTPGLPQPLGAILTEQPGDRSCSPT